jgi:hypothetical protein
MAIIAHIVLPGLTTDQYDAVRRAVGWLERPPEGGMVHLAWWEGPDNHNVDGWANEDAVNAFAQNRLGPAMAELGIAIEPQITIHPAHEVFAPQATTAFA